MKRDLSETKQKQRMEEKKTLKNERKTAVKSVRMGLKRRIRSEIQIVWERRAVWIEWESKRENPEAKNTRNTTIKIPSEPTKRKI